MRYSRKEVFKWPTKWKLKGSTPQMIRKMKVKTKCKLKLFTFQIQQTNLKSGDTLDLQRLRCHIASHTFIVNTEIGVAILEGNLPFIKFNMPY